MDIPLDVNENPWLSDGEDDDQYNAAAEAEVDAANDDGGELGDVLAIPSQSAGQGGDLLEANAGTGEVICSYSDNPEPDVDVLNAMSSQAQQLADPTLLWVILKKREQLLRRMRHEHPAEREAIKGVLAGDASQTNTLRRRAALEDEVKQRSVQLARLLKRKRPPSQRVDLVLPPGGLGASHGVSPPAAPADARGHAASPGPVQDAVGPNKPEEGAPAKAKTAPKVSKFAKSSAKAARKEGWADVPWKYQKRYKNRRSSWTG